MIETVQQSMRAKAVEAVEELSCLEFFPREKGARKAIMRLLDRMVSTPEQLDWLVETMIDRVGKWHGTAELRGVFCSKFSPKDGVEFDCIQTPSFAPSDGEMRSISQHDRIKNRELSEGARKLLGAPSAEPLSPIAEAILAPAVKSTAWPKPTKPLSLAERRRAAEVDEVLKRIMGEQ